VCLEERRLQGMKVYGKLKAETVQLEVAKRRKAGLPIWLRNGRTEQEQLLSECLDWF